MPKLGKAAIEERLRRHLASLEAGKDVSKRDMRAVLTDGQMKEYERLWENHRVYKQWLLDSRSSISDYQEILRTADAYHIRAEKVKTGSKAHSNARKAERHYERAFERLEELMENELWIPVLLDRPVDQTNTWKTGASYHGIPRYIFSQSHACDRRARESLATKRDVKMRVFKDAIEHLYKEPANAEPELAAEEIERVKKLRSILNRR